MRSYDVIESGAPLSCMERPLPIPRNTEVLLRMLASGVCHTDVHLWEGYFDLGGGRRLSMQERGIALPHTLGHEFVGEVVAVGPDADGVAIGDRRLVHPWIGCGTCPACARGDEQFCLTPRFLGVFRPGGFSDHLLIPHPRYLHAFGDLHPSEVAPLACSGLTTFSALGKFDAKALREHSIMVIGAGGLGLMCLEMMRLLDCRPPIVVEIDPEKRAAASRAGASAVVDGSRSDAASQIAALSDGGVLGVLDLVGTPETLQLGLDAIAKGGKLVVVGMFGGELALSIPLFLLRGLTLQSSYVGSPAEMAEMMALVRQKGCPRIPITQRSLSCANAALDDLRSGRVIGRTVLVPDRA